VSEITEESMRDDFKLAFDHASSHLVRAPGRVNLIGEHTDYNGGFVLPAAINYNTWVAASSRSDRELHIVAKNFSSQQVIIRLDKTMQPSITAPWSNYARGIVQELQKRNFHLTGGNLLIAGNVPTGAGLSSSASLEIALIRALTALSRETIDPTVAAQVGQAAENNFVGCNCGIMDQLISARGQAHSALLIDCQDLSCRAISIPTDWELLIVHSGVKRGLVESKYNQRRQQCEAAAIYFNERTLRGVGLEQLLVAEKKLEPLIFKRARHVISENSRTLLAADALQRNDMSSLARLMQESHVSMRDDFDITTPEIDYLVKILHTAGNDFAGARMTGGGFGGCVIAIAASDRMPELINAVETHYHANTGCEPTIIRAKASNGAF
jgi:galactokinase